ncbi:SE-cephalotoxin-like [Lineus longissimus]|uniref:SE-cephalotoxin-like n=1 Tax=Lineus longissimus TaxID=88925 RepID=UPI00315CB284
MLSAVLLASWMSLVTSSLDPGEQAKVSMAMDTAQYVLSAVNEATQAQSKAITEALKKSPSMTSVQILKSQEILRKFASTVGKALKAIQGFAAVASFIFTFFMQSELSVITDLINERFKEVNSKLDSLDEKLDAIEVSLKANTAFNTFLAMWIKWEYASKNGAKKLKDIRNAMSRTTRKIEKVKLAEEYIKYFENNNLDGNLLNLYRMASQAESTTNRNIFDRFIAEYGCDISKISQLMIIIQNVMTSAAQQELTYYFFKGDQTRAMNSFADVQNYFFEIRRAFDDRVWSCKSNSIDHARNDAKKTMKAMKDSSREDVAHAIFKELKVKYPWYTWAVAAVNSDGSSIRGLEWRGTTYFVLKDRADPDKVKSYYVVYEDTKVIASCNEIKQAKTLLVFKRCDGCNSDYIYGSDNILSGKKCQSSTLEQLVPLKDELLSSSRCPKCTKTQISSYFDLRLRRFIIPIMNHCSVAQCVKQLKTEIERWDFIASAVNINYNVCGSDKCSGHGQCKSISFTTTHQCICNSYYEGEFCEKRIEFDDKIEKMLSELRHIFNVVNGVPTAVDNYFAILSLSENLNQVWQKIKASFAHTNNLIKHSNTINQVEFVAHLYTRLQKNALTFDQFGQQLHGFLQTVSPSELEFRLKNIILGRGTLETPGNGIYGSYKREYASQNGGGCSTKYNTDIMTLRDNLSYLDQTFGEALLLHQKWLIEAKATTEDERAKHKKEAAKIYNIFKDRQKEYNEYWKSYSCGPISVSGTNVDCKSELTFEGMDINLLCDQKRKATPNTLKCQRVNGTLKWNGQPECKFVWGKYGGWGKCSKTCDGGYKFRYRSCIGTSDVTNCQRDQGGTQSETADCNTQLCCQAKYGKFKCSNGKCISKSYVCDNDNDCGNFDDERRIHCPNFIRSGDMVALESNNQRSKWLSCYCTVNCGEDRCKLRGCPGSTMDSHDWYDCAGERFMFYAIDRSDGQVVRHGDRVAFQYGWDSSTDRGNWLSCQWGYWGG